MSAPHLTEAELAALDALRSASLHLALLDLDDDDRGYFGSARYCGDASTTRDKIDKAIIALTGTFDGSGPIKIRSKNRPTSHEGRAKGGRARMAKLSPERRSEIARAAAQARWGQP